MGAAEEGRLSWGLSSPSPQSSRGQRKAITSLVFVAAQHTVERRAEGGTGPQEAPPQQSRPGWELWQKGHSEAKERPRRVAMAQKSLQGRWVGRRCPTSCHIIGKGKAPRNSLEQAQEGPRTLLCHQGRWPDLATPGLPSFLCFHPSTGGCEGTFQKDHRGASPVGGEQERQRAKASLCRPGHPLPAAN